MMDKELTLGKLLLEKLNELKKEKNELDEIAEEIVSKMNLLAKEIYNIIGGITIKTDKFKYEITRYLYLPIYLEVNERKFATSDLTYDEIIEILKDMPNFIEKLIELLNAKIAEYKTKKEKLKMFKDRFSEIFDV
jgi:arsenate reductase-like glutaredoxin family protein